MCSPGLTESNRSTLAEKWVKSGPTGSCCSLRNYCPDSSNQWLCCCCRHPANQTKQNTYPILPPREWTWMQNWCVNGVCNRRGSSQWPTALSSFHWEVCTCMHGYEWLSRIEYQHPLHAVTQRQQTTDRGSSTMLMVKLLTWLQKTHLHL